MTYQSVTGTINQGAHPGSYNGQDAYNDMLVVDDGTMPMERRASSSHAVRSQRRGGAKDAR